MSVTFSPTPSEARELAAGTDRALLTVGLDVGGTKIASVVTDGDDRILHHEVEPTDSRQLPVQLAAMVRRAVGHFAEDGAVVVGAVGVAVPGFVEPRTGSVGLAVNLGGEPLALGPILQSSVGLPCYVEHDARAAAAWLRDRSADATANLVYLSIGTGISAGIVLDGHVLRGPNGLAGEVGHTYASAGGDPCPCGLTGCIEVVAAGPAIARLAREAIAEERATSLPAHPTAADVFSAATDGDALAAEIADGVAQRLGRLIRAMVLTLGIDHVVIGGGVAAAGDALLARVNSAVARERAVSPLVDAAFANSTIELLSPEVEAGARGAAAIARRRAGEDLRREVGD